MAITRETSRQAEAAVREANSEADRLEAETQAARKRATEATKEAQTIRAKWGQIEAGHKLAAGDEMRQLSQEAAGVLAEKPDKAPVMRDSRLYARSMLANYVLGDGPPPLLRDPLWGELHGLQGRVLAFMGRVEGEELYAEADALECRLHRACLARLRWLAGEVK